MERFIELLEKRSIKEATNDFINRHADSDEEKSFKFPAWDLEDNKIVSISVTIQRNPLYFRLVVRGWSCPIAAGPFDVRESRYFHLRRERDEIDLHIATRWDDLGRHWDTNKEALAEVLRATYIPLVIPDLQKKVEALDDEVRSLRREKKALEREIQEIKSEDIENKIRVSDFIHHHYRGIFPRSGVIGSYRELKAAIFRMWQQIKDNYDLGSEK